MAGLVLEAALLPAFKLAGVKADLLMVVLSIYAFLKGAPRGAALGLVYGLLEDLYLARFVGLNALTMMVTGYLVGLSKDALNRNNLLVPGILAFLATLGQGLMFLLVGHLAGFQYPWLAGLLAVVLPVAFYNGCLALLGYSFYQGGATWVARKRKIGSPS
ncbi:MAG: rod shape-determining protein MreD [Clostridia bacterium]|nr:rod shape-determining protein MreD [Clostridia bacterium]